ncbi:MAG: TolC family protein [Bacteroidaceae bacterium]|nr:TolC family protein [Bacteroidaceae bacterium]
MNIKRIVYTIPLRGGRKLGLIGILCCGLLSSCGLYTKYERPDVNTAGIIRDPVSLGDTLLLNTDGNFGDLPWREVFTDPVLQRLIEECLEHNPDIKNAALDVHMVESQLKMAKLAFIPTFQIGGSGTVSSWDFGKATQSYSFPLQASWTIDLFGGVLNLKRSTQMTFLASKDAQVAVQTRLIAAVANMYYTLLCLDKDLEILGEMEALTKDTWDMMKQMKTLGRTRETSVQSAEAAYYSVQSKTVDMKRQIREVENSLSLLLGRPAGFVQRGRIEDQHLPEKFSCGVGLQLLANRADVHAYEMNLAACFYDVNKARSAFYPSLTISAQGAFTNLAGSIINPGSILASAVASLTQPLFMNGRLIAQLKVAKDLYQQAYNKWEHAILTAGSEVSNALVQYNASAEKQVLDQKQVDAYEKNVEYTKNLFKLGSSNYLEVITAQQSLLNAKISKISDDMSKMQAIVSLYQALGGGSK